MLMCVVQRFIKYAQTGTNRHGHARKEGSCALYYASLPASSFSFVCGLCGLSLALLSLSLLLSLFLSLSLLFVLPLSLFPSSPFSSSFCVKFTFAHQDLFQQQNLRSTRKSLLRTSTVLSPSLFLSLCTRGFSHSILTHLHRIRVPVPCPCHASHLIIIMQSILLIIQNCA